MIIRYNISGDFLAERERIARGNGVCGPGGVIMVSPRELERTVRRRRRLAKMYASRESSLARFHSRADNSPAKTAITRGQFANWSRVRAPRTSLNANKTFTIFFFFYCVSVADTRPTVSTLLLFTASVRSPVRCTQGVRKRTPGFRGKTF